MIEHTLIATRLRFLGDGVGFDVIDIGMAVVGLAKHVLRRPTAPLVASILIVVFNHTTELGVETILLEKVSGDLVFGMRITVRRGVGLGFKMYMAGHLDGCLDGFTRQIGLPKGLHGAVELFLVKEGGSREQHVVIKDVGGTRPMMTMTISSTSRAEKAASAVVTF